MVLFGTRARGLQNLTSKTIPQQLTEVMSDEEVEVTGKLLRVSSIAGLSLDGRDMILGVRFKMVCWAWPTGLPKCLPHWPTGVVSLNNSKAPWVVDRAAGAEEMKADHRAEN